MKTITPESLSNKLKNAPQSVLGKVAGYIDALLDEEVILFQLTEKQKKILDSQEKLSPSDYIQQGKQLCLYK